MDSSDIILTSLVLLTYPMIGLCLGSFSSAIAHRIAQKKSWIVDKNSVSGGNTPARSSCPSCHNQLSVLDLVPVFSWVFLGGKCRYCKTPISPRYPFIEACGAVAMIAFFYVGGAGAIGPSLLAFVITLPFSLALLLLCLRRARAPFYLYGLFFSNVFVVLSTVLWGK